MKHGKNERSRKDALPAALARYFVGRRVILTLDSGQKLTTRIRTKPQRWPGGAYRVQVEGRDAWYSVSSLAVDTSNQLELKLVSGDVVRGRDVR